MPLDALPRGRLSPPGTLVLDFVSLAFMPVSMAFAGPAGEGLGLPVVFLIAGVAPLVIGVVAIIAARMTRDELAHPLDAVEDEPDAAELIPSSTGELAAIAA